MPTRSRSHQLEDLSFTRFRDLLPDQWVLRRKGSDYGVDFEVEIFDEDGSSTGLLFHGQLKATDDPASADRVALKTDTLRYLLAFDIPAGVVRYCSATGSFYWQWASNIAGRLDLKSGQKSFTYRYCEAERWDDGTLARIRQRLDSARGLRRFPAGAPISVRLDLDKLPSASRYPVERALAGAIAQSNGTLVRASAVAEPVEVIVVPEPAFLSVTIGNLAGVTFDLANPEPESYSTVTLYAIVVLLHTNQLSRQAEAVARLVLRRGLPILNENLALTACQALGADLDAMVEIAILNGLSDPSSLYHAIIPMMIVRSAQADDTRRRAFATFFDARITAAKSDGQYSEAAAHYSAGNFYRSQRMLLLAFKHYNRARRLRPAYLKSDYFLREIGGAMFEARRYAGAVRAYSAALDLGDTPLLRFMLGDALLLAGRIGEARGHLENAASQAKMREAALKSISCAWLAETSGLAIVPRRHSELYAVMGPGGHEDIPTLERIVEQVDALCGLSHFNLGIYHERQGDRFVALHHFLLCTCVQPGDVGAWAAAAICALSLGDEILLSLVMTVAIERNGSDCYDRLRSDLIAQGASEALIVTLDEAAMMILAEAEESGEPEFTLRLLNGDDYEVLVIGGKDDG